MDSPGTTRDSATSPVQCSTATSDGPVHGRDWSKGLNGDSVWLLAWVGLCLATVFHTVRLAWAEWRFREGTAESIRWAARSGNTEYWLALAVAEGLDALTRKSALETAVSQNPFASAAWIRLGLLEESAGRMGPANRALATAEHVDHQYLPAWTRANLAFRQGDHTQFWKSARMAAQKIYDDPRPLLDLADRSVSGVLECLNQLGAGPLLERSYLDMLIDQNRWPDAVAVASKIQDRVQSAVKVPGPPSGQLMEDFRRLAAFVDHLLSTGHAVDALPIWNGLSARGAHPFAQLRPTEGAILTNGDFAFSPTGAGFDWRVNPAAGTQARWRRNEMEFIISGSQSEASELLDETMVMSAGHYVLRVLYRIELNSPGRLGADLGNYPVSTLGTAPIHFWVRLDGDRIKAALGLAAPGPGIGFRKSELVFSIGDKPVWDHPVRESSWRQTGRRSPFVKPGQRLVTVHLRLLYKREEGSTPFRGMISVREFHLDPLDALARPSVARPAKLIRSTGEPKGE